MSFRFHRSISIIPGVRLNLGKTGVSLSAGAPGAHITVGKKGVRTTVGLPGTGLSLTDHQSLANAGDAGERLSMLHEQRAALEKRMSAQARWSELVDELDGAKNVQVYWFAEGEVRGPESYLHVISQVQAKKLPLDTPVCRAGSEEWQVVDTQIVATLSVIRKKNGLT